MYACDLNDDTNIYHIHLLVEKAMIIVGMLDAFERKYRANFVLDVKLRSNEIHGNAGLFLLGLLPFFPVPLFFLNRHRTKFEFKPIRVDKSTQAVKQTQNPYTHKSNTAVRGTNGKTVSTPWEMTTRCAGNRGERVRSGGISIGNTEL